ncbi:MAG: hypothetical protein L0241_13395, partial [Planctomycetia bacterium]|nr:hypothetical protein [Planctomycetia bacterium]
MTSAKTGFSALVACVVTAVVPSLASATEVKIDNVSNDDIYVAIAYKFWKGDLASEGWFKIGSNNTKTFFADDESDMHLRVLNKKGNEILWKNYKTYANWTIHPTSRFTVSRSPLNKEVRVYRWGSKLENDFNARKGDP